MFILEKKSNFVLESFWMEAYRMIPHFKIPLVLIIWYMYKLDKNVLNLGLYGLI